MVNLVFFSDATQYADFREVSIFSNLEGEIKAYWYPRRSVH
jgi:hypothetical protein